MVTTSDLIGILEDLIETCEDGRKGYLEAAEEIENSDLRRQFNEYSRQRQEYVSELKELIKTFNKDEKISESGSLGAGIHRGWMNLKAALTGNDNEAILNEVLSSEDAAVKNYEEAFKNDLPEDVNTTLRIQYSGIKEARGRIKALHDNAEKF